MVNHDISHIVLVVHIVNAHQAAAFLLDGKLIIGSEEIIVEHHNFITLQMGKEISRMRFLLQGDERTYLLHLTHLIRGRMASKEGTIKIVLQHIGQSQSTDKVTVADGSACVGTEIDFFQEMK